MMTMALSASLRKLTPLTCLLCHSHTAPHRWGCLTYGNIYRIMQRWKHSTIKSPEDDQINQRLKNSETGKSRILLKKLPKVVKLSKRKMKSLEPEVIQKKDAKISIETNNCKPQKGNIELVSLREVMESVQANLINGDTHVKPELTDSNVNIKKTKNNQSVFNSESKERQTVSENLKHGAVVNRSTRKIVFTNKRKLSVQATTEKEGIENPPEAINPKHRTNVIGIQTLSSSLYDQIFRNMKLLIDNEAEENMQEMKQHLEDHGLWGRPTSVIPDIDLKLPELIDQDLDQHFRNIAEDQCISYKNLLNQLVGSALPNCPNKWEFTPGWTQYNVDGSSTPVDHPGCQCLVFDVEVCMSEGSHPTLATAVSDKHWYSWCSKQLTDSDHHTQDRFTLEDLIPLETPQNIDDTHPKRQDIPRVIVGHNVSYDRIRVREQYLMEGTSLRFVDTMSLHIAVSGLVAEQRALKLKNKTNPNPIRLPWMNVGCQNSLNDVYKFYCRTKEGLQKSTRDTFVKGSLNDVREDFQNLMSYCASDVKATHMVLVKLLPRFYERFPHPVTFAGMLEMGQAFLPVTKNWKKYIEAAESEYHRVERSLNEELVKQAQAALGYMKDEKFKEDPWLWSLDWSVPKGRVRKLPGYPNWYRKLCAKTGELEGTPEPENMSTSLQVVPRLLRLMWNGYPLHYEKKHGWCYLKPLYERYTQIPSSELLEYNPSAEDQPEFPVKEFYHMIYGSEPSPLEPTYSKETKDYVIEEKEWEEFFLEHESQVANKSRRKRAKLDYIDLGIPGVGLVPLPHKDGAGYRVGNPLAKDFLPKIEDQTLSSYLGNVAELVLKTNKTLSYWKNNRDRIMSQLPVWLPHHLLPHSVLTAEEYSSSDEYGVMVPGVVVAGTITRRAVERTWMTASNAYTDRIGSELKAMVTAPPGYCFVGADVDSQELWIAGLLGDAYFVGEHGGTALGWMMLQGNKADGTDMHSRTAVTTGVSRNSAKVINYGRIYGAGLKFMQRLLKQFNPSLSEDETKQRAQDLFTSTKGERAWSLNQEGHQLATELGFSYHRQHLTSKEIRKLVRLARENNIDATFGSITLAPYVWVGGSESHMFNCLEAIARSEVPQTPVLGARITRALEPWCVDDDFMTSRVNWVVQSSAVDYLHIMLVCMRWLFTKYQIPGRFCISIHDEVRYMVAKEDSHHAALALQITNLLTRSYFALRLGFHDLPQSVAFFSGVDIDQVLRKEPHLDCVTPSNPLGLQEGYGVPPGVTLNMQELMDITQGELAKRQEK